MTPHGAWKGWKPAAGEIVRELLDARLVRDGGERVRRARRRLGRILAARAVHLVELLGQRVVGLELVVGDRPGGRDAVVVPQLAEVLLRAVGTAPRRRASSRRRRSSAPAAETACPWRRTTCRARRSGWRRRRPRPASSAARAAASRRARAAGRACPTGPGGGRACRPPAPLPMMIDVVRLSCSCDLLDPFGQDDSPRGLDQGEMGERLREVAEMSRRSPSRTPRRRARVARRCEAGAPSGRGPAASRR